MLPANSPFPLHWPGTSLARRGTALYAGQVRPKVEAGNHGKVVALDVDMRLRCVHTGPHIS
jgi:hypothetical protein